MTPLALILLCFAFVFFVFAWFNGGIRGWNLIGAGLALWVLVQILFGAKEVFHF